MMKPLQMLSLLFGFVCLYIYWYMRQVRKPRIIMKEGDPVMNRLLLKQLKLDQVWYYPLFIATGGWAQMLVWGILEAKAYLEYLFALRKMIPYEREVVQTDQGNAVLHWVKAPTGCESKPVVVIYPGIVAHHEDVLITDSVDLLVAASYEVVVYNRRGHENDSEYFSVMGDQYLNDIVLASINRKRPGRGLFLFGFSAGTATISRFMLDLAMERRSCWNGVRFVSMISPGYTSDIDAEANIWALNGIIGSLNSMFLSEIHKEKFPEVVSRLQKCKELKKWIAIAGELSGYGTVESWREHCCPGHVWPVLDTFTGAKLDAMKYFPAVVFNARDDVLFPWGLVRKYAHLFLKVHSFALIDTDHGSHCTYFDNRVRNWAVRMSIRIFDQVVRNGVGEGTMREDN